MPCSAKKMEAKLDKFYVDKNPDTDHVVTTVSLANMIKAAGIDFASLPDEEYDTPFGTKTGAGVIFGASGGVMEAALRYAAAELDPKAGQLKFNVLRESKEFKEATVNVAGHTIRVAVTSGLKNARKLLDDVKAGKAQYDFIEVMSCPGGCTLSYKSQDNKDVMALYGRIFKKIGDHKAHELLHTHYQDRKDRTGQK